MAGHATIRGQAARADGSPFVGTASDGVLVSCGPGRFGGFRVPTDARGAYELRIDAISLPASDTVPCALAIGVPVFAAETALVAFSRDLRRRAVTVVNIRERARTSP